MASENQNTIAIFLVNNALEEIEDKMQALHSASPYLDAESERKHRDTMNVLHELRSLRTEAERLNQENMRLNAKHMQLQRQTADINKDIEKQLEINSELEKSLHQAKQERKRNLHVYEDFMKKIADEFRASRCFYDEEAMEGKLEEVKKTTVEFEGEAKKRRSEVYKLKQQLDGLVPAVPDDLLTIIGKKGLDDKNKALDTKIKELTAERDALIQKQKFAQNYSA